MTVKTESRVHDFEEIVCTARETFAEATISKDSSVIENVKLLGAVSKNGHRYSDKALTDAASKYNGVPFYVDHPSDRDLREKKGVRSVMDLAGKITGARRVGDSVRGNIELLEGDPIAEKVRRIAGQMPEQAGNSHRARGPVRPTPDGNVVEGIDMVFAMELVSSPATTKGLFESFQGDEPEPTTETTAMKDVTLTDLKEQRPDLVKALFAESEDADKVKALEEENTNLKKENDDYKAKAALEGRKALVEQKIEDAKMPKQLVTDLFKTQLMEAKDEKAIDALIEDRKGLAVSKGSRPKSVEREAPKGDLREHKEQVTELKEEEFGDWAERIGIGSQTLVS